MREIWKDIRGYEGLYQVSNQGRVKSLPRIGTGNQYGQEIRILKPWKANGYSCITLCGNFKKRHKVHRLVAEAFLPNPNNYPCVNHKDENKSNNCVDNLEWCSYEYNNTYGSKTKQFKKPVMQYSLEGQELCYWFSAADASKGLNKGYHFICNAASGRRHSAYGYLWKYVG